MKTQTISYVKKQVAQQILRFFGELYVCGA